MNNHVSVIDLGRLTKDRSMASHRSSTVLCSVGMPSPSV